MKPKLLDLFCCAGGAGVGYSRAGFEVVGVDINPQPRYPFEFHQANALDYLSEHGHEFDVIHASPPCQRYSRCTPQHAKERHDDLIAQVRKLMPSEKYYVIENVDTARHLLINPITLCGTYFGLKVLRHRCFESNAELSQPAKCSHKGMVEGVHYVSVHDGTMNGNSRKILDAKGYKLDSSKATAAYYAEAMDIDWMQTRKEIAEAIPPAYTEFIGAQISKRLTQRPPDRLKSAPLWAFSQPELFSTSQSLSQPANGR